MKKEMLDKADEEFKEQFADELADANIAIREIQTRIGDEKQML